MSEEVAPSDDYSIADWEKIWKEYNPNKKERKVTEELKEYIKELFPDEDEKGSIFLPLCGMTPDLRWLYDEGYTVVGLDGVEVAIRALVQKNDDLNFTEEVMEDKNMTCFSSEDARMKLYISDILNKEVKKLGPFDACFDYGAYTAIKPSDRKKYVKQVMGCMSSSFRYILEFCHDVSADCEDHPCIISFQTMKKEIGRDNQLKILETNDVSELWNADSFFNTFVLVTPKED